MVKTELSPDTCSKMRGSGASPTNIEKGSQNDIKKPSTSSLGAPREPRQFRRFSDTWATTAAQGGGRGTLLTEAAVRFPLGNLLLAYARVNGTSA